MKKTTMYTKEFSKLGRLQEASRICYNLLEEDEDGPAFGVELVGFYQGIERADRITRCFGSREEAVLVLAFLYENAVTCDAWRDVMEDLMAP